MPGEADGDVIKTGEVPFPGVCVSAHRGCLVNSSDKSLIVSQSPHRSQLWFQAMSDSQL